MENDQLLNVILKCRTLQEFVDDAAKQISCPFWVMDAWYHPRAVSHHPDAMSIYNQFVKNTSLMDSLHRWEKFHVFIGDIHSSPSRFFDDLLNNDVIIIDVLDRGNVVGRATFFPQQEIASSVIEQVSAGLSVYLRTGEGSPNFGAFHQAFENLLANKDKDASAAVLNGPDWDLLPPYQVHCVANEHTDFLLGCISYMNEVDERLLPVMHEDALYFLSSKTHKVDLVKHMFPVMGSSFPFEEISLIPYYGMQAKYLADHPSNGLSDYVCDLLQKETDLTCLIAPEVRECIRYDEIYQTQYYKTLVNYLRCGENKQRTAQMMNLHLNTIKYRIGQLQKLFSIDVEEKREELFLSCMIAEREKKK